MDAKGDVYLAGWVSGEELPVTANAFQRECRPGGWLCQQGFVAKVSGDGSRLMWATYVGGSGSDEIRSIAVDAAGNVHVGGMTSSSDFPLSPGAQRRVPGAGFVATLSSDGARLLASTYVDGEVTSVVVDSQGALYAGGFTRSSAFRTTPGAFQGMRYPESTDGFVVKFDPALSSLQYSTLLGGSRTDEVHAIAVDSWGQAHATGQTDSLAPDAAVVFPPSGDGFQRRSDTRDVFVVKLNASGPA